MNKLGFIVPHLGPSQLAYTLLRNIQEFMSKRYDTDIILFYENLVPPCFPVAAATMQIHEAYSYDGHLVATTLSSAEKLLRFPGPRQRTLYVWDLEWLRMPVKSYEELRRVYATQELTLIARCPDHAKIIGDVWRHQDDVGVIEDFELEVFLGEDVGNL